MLDEVGQKLPSGLAEEAVEGGGGFARHSTSMRWARLIARPFGHGHRAACGGGRLFEGGGKGWLGRVGSRGEGRERQIPRRNQSVNASWLMG